MNSASNRSTRQQRAAGPPQAGERAQPEIAEADPARRRGPARPARARRRSDGGTSASRSRIETPFVGGRLERHDGRRPARLARCGASRRTRCDAALESGGKCGLTISTRRIGYVRDSTQTPAPALTDPRARPARVVTRTSPRPRRASTARGRPDPARAPATVDRLVTHLLDCVEAGRPQPQRQRLEVVGRAMLAPTGERCD